MEKLDFNKDWLFKRLSFEGEPALVTLPHDALSRGPLGQVNDEAQESCECYEYIKKFVFPREMKDKCLTLEFEGVYPNAEVYINGEKVCENESRCASFYADITGKVIFKKENEIKVIVNNSAQPSSRLYSGAGIFRPVNLIVQEQKHIIPGSIKIRTLSINPAVIEVRVKTEGDGPVYCIVNRNGKRYGSGIARTANGAEGRTEIPVRWEALWSPSSPELYTLSVRFKKDAHFIKFGLRLASLSKEEGFCLNGEKFTIKGCCIRGDGGILGARSSYEIEERKIRLLKESGFNAVKMLWGPSSSEMLDACDSLGMLVVDECYDALFEHKAKCDYAGKVIDNYERDLKDMVDKDYSHPSVIMYSLFSSAPESSSEKGLKLIQDMVGQLKALDEDRFITAGINILSNNNYFKKKASTSKDGNIDEVYAIDYYESLIHKKGTKYANFLTKLPWKMSKVKETFSLLDCSGYNYATARYKKDIIKSVGAILGTEIFIEDLYDSMKLAETESALIGNFVNAGSKFIGESKEYYSLLSGANGDNLSGDYKWISSTSGCLDLLWNETSDALYASVVLGKTDTPIIVAAPASSETLGKCAPGTRFTNAIPSWSWNGLDLSEFRVEVFSKAPVVELFINGKKVGRSSSSNKARFTFNVLYEHGNITAVALDEKGNELSRSSLQTAKDFTIINLNSGNEFAISDSLVFVNIDYTDDDGNLKPLENGHIKVDVSGGELIALGCAAPYSPEGYGGIYTDTYNGRALAVISAHEKGKLRVTADDGKRIGKLEMDIKRPAKEMQEEIIEDEEFFEES